ncbi:MAG: hypothetical protein KTR28_06900 [Micavibrio sp.]|nr:hypothetical protein [Micavibrio sp.]
MDDRELDSLLARRATVKAPKMLAHNIAARAVMMPQDIKEQRGFRDFFVGLKETVSDYIYLPQPVFVVAALVLFGFVAGMFGYENVLVTDSMNGTEEVSTFLVINDQYMASQFLSEVES